MLDLGEIEQCKVWSFAGKVIHIKDLVVGGNFHLYHLLNANAINIEKQHTNCIVQINLNLKRGLFWWHTMVTISEHRTKYPN